jgi:hypothetical protein
MGYYAEPTLTASLSAVPFFVSGTKVTTSGTYVDVIKISADFTDIDYLNVNFTSRHDGGGVAITCDIDGTTKFTDATPGDGVFNDHEITCTSLVGILDLTVQVKSNNGVNDAWIENVSIFNRKA